MVHENMTKEMCEQKHKAQANDISEIKQGIKDIKYMLLGNGKLGIIGKVEILWGVSLFMATTMIVTMIKVWLL